MLALVLTALVAASPSVHTRNACRFLAATQEPGRGGTVEDLKAIVGNPHLNPFGQSETIGRHVLRQAYAGHLARADHPALAEQAATLLELAKAAGDRREESKGQLHEPLLPHFVHVEPGDSMHVPYPGFAFDYRPEKPFDFASRLLTQRQAAFVMGRSPHPYYGPLLPAFHGDAAMDVLLSTHEGPYRYRLPTFAEWIYVATNRGQNIEALFGNFEAKQLLRQAWLKENSGNGLHPVGQLEPILFDGQRVYDLLGLLYEYLDFEGGPQAHVAVGGSIGTEVRDFVDRRENWPSLLVGPSWASSFGIRLVREEKR